MAGAERALAEATVREAGNPMYVYNRGLALLRLKRRDEAVTEFRRAEAAGSAEARAKLGELGADKKN
jgi:hypothetical protein